MPNKDDALRRDEIDAVSAEILLKRLREGLEQTPSVKDDDEKTSEIKSAQISISEETMRLAKAELIHGEPEKFENSGIDEDKLREIMNLPKSERTDRVPLEENADVIGSDDPTETDCAVEEKTACEENSHSEAEFMPDLPTFEPEEYDSDPWYDNEEEALSAPIARSDDAFTHETADEDDPGRLAYTEDPHIEGENGEEIDEGFLAQVAKMIDEDSLKTPMSETESDPENELGDDFDFVDNTDDELVEPDPEEKLPPISEDGGREYSGLNGNEMNSVEMQLHALFESRKELEKTYGKERAAEMFKAGDDFSRTRVPKKKRFFDFFGVDEEYISSEQNDELKSRYTRAFGVAVIKFLLCIIFACGLFMFENASLLGIKLPSLLDVTVYPTVCTMLDLQLVFLCALMLIDKLAMGFAALFKFKPVWESVPALLLTASTLYTTLIATLPGTRTTVLYNFPVAICFVFTLLYDIMNLKREAMSFDVVSSGHRKYTIRKLTDEERTENAELFEEYVPKDSPMFAVTKTEFVEGFVRRTRTHRSSRQLLSIILVALAEAFLALGVGILTNADANSVVTMAFLTFVLGLPGTLMLAAAHPFYRVSKNAFESESTIVGEGALEEYCDGSVVFFEDKDIFPSTGVKINSVKVYGENRIDGVIYYAASIFARIGGPLADVFGLATIEIGHSENVKILDSTDCGLHCDVDGESLYLGSNDYMKSLDFETPYGDSDEAVEKNNGIRLMYIADENEILAKFYVQYTADSEYELIFRQLYKAGMCVGVRTHDPNIGDEFVARKLRLKSDYPMKVVHGRPECEYIRRSKCADSGIVSAGSVKSLLRTLSACDRIKYIAKIHGIFEIVAAALPIFAVYALTALDKLGIGSAYAALYQLFWLIPIMLVTLLTE